MFLRNPGRYGDKLSSSTRHTPEDQLKTTITGQTSIDTFPQTIRFLVLDGHEGVYRLIHQATTNVSNFHLLLVHIVLFLLVFKIFMISLGPTWLKVILYKTKKTDPPEIPTVMSQEALPASLEAWQEYLPLSVN